jgi:hypothetical protein
MTDEEPRKWRGIRTIGGDLQVSDISITFDDDGNAAIGQPQIKLRTDMWPFWVEDALEAAATSCQMADQIPALVAQLDDAGELRDQIDRQIDRLMIRESFATMRAITASAFAIDAFYATVKERCGPHPHDGNWRHNGTSREKRITETLKYYLHLKANEVNNVESCVAQVFKFRDRAAHMEVKFRDPVYREDVEAGVDWHFHEFRRENAVNAVQFSLMVLDYLVSILDRGGGELAKCKPLAQERMEAIFGAYEQIRALPKFQRTSKQVTDTGQ